MFLVMNNKPGYFSHPIGIFDTRIQAGNEILRTIEALNKDGDYSEQSHFTITELQLNKNYVAI
jgi:hypothetical protein